MGMPAANAAASVGDQSVLAPGRSLQVDDPHASSLPAELTLLGSAQYHLRRGETADALTYLDRHAARFPTGALWQERTAARAIALCSLGRLSEGRAEISALEGRAPGSPLLPRAREACR